MEIEPPSRAPSDAEREAAAERLTGAAGDGRLTLEELSDRVGVVWGAESHEQLALATAGIEAPPPVEAVPGWRRWLLGEESPPVPTPPRHQLPHQRPAPPPPPPAEPESSR